MSRWTPKQVEDVRRLTLTTSKPAEEIARDAKVSPSGARNFWRTQIYPNDKAAYDARVQAGSKHVTEEQLKQIEQLTRTTNLTAEEIASKTSTSEIFVRDRQKDVIFNGNPDAYKQHKAEVRFEARNGVKKKPPLSEDAQKQVTEKILANQEALQKEVARGCDRTRDQEAYDRDVPARGEKTLDAYLPETAAPAGTLGKKDTGDPQPAASLPQGSPTVVNDRLPHLPPEGQVSNGKESPL